MSNSLSSKNKKRRSKGSASRRRPVGPDHFSAEAAAADELAQLNSDDFEQHLVVKRAKKRSENVPIEIQDSINFDDSNEPIVIKKNANKYSLRRRASLFNSKKINSTDFVATGLYTVFVFDRFSVSSDIFFDRNVNSDVYLPDLEQYEAVNSYLPVEMGDEHKRILFDVCKMKNAVVRLFYFKGFYHDLDALYSIIHLFMTKRTEHSSSVSINSFVFTDIELYFFRQVLAFGLHAISCPDPVTCSVPCCVHYLLYVRHFKACSENACKYPFCYFFRTLVSHFNHCMLNESCNLCDYLFSFNDQNKKKSRHLVTVLVKYVVTAMAGVKREIDDYLINPETIARFISYNFFNYMMPNFDIENMVYAEFPDFEKKSDEDFFETLKKFDSPNSITKNKVNLFGLHKNMLKNLDNDLKNLNTLFYHFSGSSENYSIYIEKLAGFLFGSNDEQSPPLSLKFHTRIADYASVLFNSPNSIFEIENEYQCKVVNLEKNFYPRHLQYNICGMIDFVEANKKNRNAFTPADIKSVFLPICEQLKEHADSFFFVDTVDPFAFHIPDYFRVISHPMDLNVVIDRLNRHYYVEPFEVIHDFYQIVTNATTYNKKNNRVYKLAVRFKEMYLEIVQSRNIAGKLLMCCSERRLFTPQSMFCINKDYCIIARDAYYYSLENYYTYCEKCFAEQSETFSVIKSNSTDDSSTKMVSKSEFSKLKNNKLFSEEFVQCDCCFRFYHTVCVGYSMELYGNKYTCKLCAKGANVCVPFNFYSSVNLRATPLTDHIEGSIRGYMAEKGLGYDELPLITVRMLFNTKKDISIKKQLVEKYPHLDFSILNNTKLSYWSKAIFAFQRVGNSNALNSTCSEICFFAMHTQEYDANAPKPNANRVYLGYLDSVHFMQPKKLKTDIYYRILMGYFDYCALRGFSYIHIWACPPCEGDDYIFHCHPPEQKIPKHKRLSEWYQKLLEECVRRGVILNFVDLYKHIMREGQGKIENMPYFEGDYWAATFEDVLNDDFVDDEEKVYRVVKSEDEEAEKVVPTSDKHQNVITNFENDTEENPDEFKNLRLKMSDNHRRSNKKNNKKKRSKSSYVTTEKKIKVTPTEKILKLIEKYCSVFFVLKLDQNKAGKLLQSNLLKNNAHVNEVQLSIDLIDGRSGLLALCREKSFEFSTMRRTLFATQGILIELHLQYKNNSIIHTCNVCKCHLFIAHQCRVCTDFELCPRCFIEEEHQHEMVRAVLNSNVSETCLNRAYTNEKAEIPWSRLDFITSSSPNSNTKAKTKVINDENKQVNKENAALMSHFLTLDKKAKMDFLLTETAQNVLKFVQYLSHSFECFSYLYKMTQENDKSVMPDELCCLKVGNICDKLKMYIFHIIECRVVAKQDCPYCKMFLVVIQAHSDRCQNDDCTVIFCRRFKKMEVNLRKVKNKNSDQSTQSQQSTPVKSAVVKSEPAVSTPPPLRPHSAFMRNMPQAKRITNLQNSVLRKTHSCSSYSSTDGGSERSSTQMSTKAPEVKMINCAAIKQLLFNRMTNVNVNKANNMYYNKVGNETALISAFLELRKIFASELTQTARVGMVAIVKCYPVLITRMNAYALSVTKTVLEEFYMVERSEESAENAEKAATKEELVRLMQAVENELEARRVGKMLKKTLTIKFRDNTTTRLSFEIGEEGACEIGAINKILEQTREGERALCTYDVTNA